ncbi:MAG: autotransporter-associated beta strand repeat-containing protein [Kiritimatiellae bacterium]|nr:autotransporter-associated beta strand repeat-containing protein [Kiritimatiellia bacterium]
MNKLTGAMMVVACAKFAWAGSVSLSNPAGGGCWNDPATWSGGVLPAAGDDLLIEPAGDITLSLAADVAVDFRSLVLRPSNGLDRHASLTFDAGTHSLLLPCSAEGRYAEIPFLIADGGLKWNGNPNEFLEVVDSDIAAELKGKAAPVKLDKARFTLSQTARGAVFRLERGTFNAYDPDGTAYEGRRLRFQNYAQGSRFEACGGTTLEWPSIVSGWNYPGGFLFDGANVNIHGNAAFGNANRYYPNGIAVVSATNSTINVSGIMGLYGKLEHLGEVMNIFDRCGMSVGTLVSDWGANAIFSNCRLAVSLSTVIGEYGAGSVTEAVFDGGEYFLAAPKIGMQASAGGRLSVRGGAVVEFGKPVPNDAGQHIGWRGTGVVDVVNGTLRTENKLYHSLYVGAYGDDYGTGSGVLNVYEGGRVVQRTENAIETDGIAVGGVGYGVLNVCGGDVFAMKIHVGWKDACRHSLTQEVRQTGGRVRTDGDSATYSYVGLAAYAGCGFVEFDTRNVPQRAAYYLDGGVLETARIYGGLGSACRGGSGYSKFSADGGVLMQNASPGPYRSMTGFDLAEFGDKGLVFDSNGYDVGIDQDLVDKAGESGVFVKTGWGELSYTGVCSVASLRIEGGGFKVENGAIIRSAVAVGEDAALSLEGGIESLELPSLAITNGIVRLDPGDRITVNGDFSADGFNVLFTEEPEMGEVQEVLAVNGTVDEETRKAIERAFTDVHAGDDSCMDVEIGTSGGRTVVSVRRIGCAAPIGEEKTSLWKGSGGWSDPSNWEPSGVPGTENKAAFSDAGSASVTVGAEALVGAIAFTAGDHRIEGSGVIGIAAGEGAAEVSSAGGANTVSVPVRFDSKVKIPVEEGSVLDFEGAVGGPGFEKTGLGTLRLGNANAFGAALSHSEGTLSLGCGASLGEREIPALRFTGGVLAVSNETGAAVSLRRHVEMDSGQVPVVFNASTDASVALRPLSGPVVKRGAGTLTFEFSEVQNTFPSGQSVPDSSYEVGFDANGSLSSDTQPPGSLVVAEGRLRLAAKEGSLNTPKITFDRPVVVGARYRDAKAAPILELNGVAVLVNHFYGSDLVVGMGMGGSATPHLNDCALVMSNATLATQAGYGYPQIGQYTGDGVTPRLSMANSRFVAENQVYFGGRNGTKNVRLEAVDSVIDYGNAFYVTGGLAGDVANTVITSDRAEKNLSVSYNYAGERPAGGYLRLAAGSELHVNRVKWCRPDTAPDAPYVGDFRLIFDDAAWTVGESDIALEYTGNNRLVDPNLFSVECRKGGLRLPVLAGRTFSSDCRFFGEGGIVKTGGGTLKFGNGAYDLSGVTRIEEGTLDLSDAGTVTNAVFAGSGTIRGATFGRGVCIDPGIGAGWTTGDVPVLENCSFSGTLHVKIDPSLASSLKPSATGVAVARFTGTPPDVSRWRVSRIWDGEKGVRGRFEVQGDTVRMTVDRFGFSVIVR